MERSPGRAVLVTGAAGFIGSHLTERLVARGQRVIGLDNFDDFYDVALKRGNLRRVNACSEFRLVEGDIRDSLLVRRLLEEESVGSIVHLAARAGVRPSIEQPDLYADVNVRGTTTIFEAARRAGVRRVVYASSSSVYGGNTKVPFHESDPVEHPVSPYAATKRACELLASTYHHLYGLDLIGLRFFTVYGPRQRPEMAIHLFTRAIDEGRPVPMFGDGSTRRDYTYIDDIIDGLVAALDRGRGCRLYNLGESATTTLAELIELIGEALGKRPQLDRRPLQAGDVPITYADVSSAKADLGYDPRVPVREGVRRFVAWYREHRLPTGA